MPPTPSNDPSPTWPVVRLSDGSLVQLRPLSPDDRPRVQEAFRRLSKESRFKRFFTPLEVLDGKLLERLTSADGVDHVVWAALDPENPDDPGLGAASFWRSTRIPSEAEFSVTVADEHHGRGIGTLLLATLWVLARRVGIERFRLIALSDNFPVIHWMDSIGAKVDGENEDICEMLVDLCDEARPTIPMTPEGDALVEWLDQLRGIL